MRIRYQSTVLPALLVAALLPDIAHAQLDRGWTVQVDGKVGYVLADGSFRVNNISAQDNFGRRGPGTPPDGESDRLFRAEGVSTDGGKTRYFVSNSFRLRRDLTETIERVIVTERPPAMARSLRIDAASTGIPLGETGSLRVIASMNDGSEVDVTGFSEGTTLISSNREILAVSEDGSLETRRRGVVFITANRFGVTSSRRFEVLVEDISATIEGFVQLPDGSPAEGAIVSFGFGGEGLTDANGQFSITAGLPPGTEITVSVELAGETVSFVGTATAIVEEDGVLDLGIITLAPGAAAPLFSHPAIDPDDVAFGLAVGDFDLDGDNDVVTSAKPDPRSRTYTVYLFRGDGDGGFGGKEALHVDQIRRSVVADIDGNGSDDIVYDTNRNVTIALNSGDARFDARQNLVIDQLGSRTSLLVGDVDGNETLDIAFTVTNGRGLVGQFALIYANDGEARFTLLDSIEGILDPMAGALGDVDGDGDLDMVAGRQESKQLTFLINDGSGHFDAEARDPIPLPSEDTRRSFGQIVFADLDLNGIDDMLLTDIFCCPGRGDLFVYLANPDGELSGFDAPSVLAESRPARFPTIGDLDGDGDLDVVISTQLTQDGGASPSLASDSADLSILENDGTGVLTIVRRLSSSAQVADIQLADLDSQNELDLVVNHLSARAIGLLFSEGGFDYAQAPKYNVGGLVRSLAFGDVDGDAIPDLVAGRQGGISLRPGDGFGAFGATETVLAAAASAEPIIEIADLDGDGRNDLVTAINQPCCDQVTPLTVLFREDEGFSEPVTIGLSQNGRPADVAAIDLGGAGIVDILVSLEGSRELVIIEGLGDGDFAEPARIALGDVIPRASPAGLESGDVDGDGDLDVLLITRGGAPHALLFRNDGTGSLGDPEPLVDEDQGVFTSYTGVLVDVGGSSALDLVLGTANGIMALYGDGAGSFLIGVETRGLSDIQQIVPADLDGDGDSDLAGLINSAVMITLLNEGDGNFVEEGRYLAGWGPRAITALDIDRDGDIDVGVGNYGRDNPTVSVFLNRRIDSAR